MPTPAQEVLNMLNLTFPVDEIALDCLILRDTCQCPFSRLSVEMKDCPKERGRGSGGGGGRILQGFEMLEIRAVDENGESKSTSHTRRIQVCPGTPRICY